jgi:hypothetical protein
MLWHFRSCNTEKLATGNKTDTTMTSAPPIPSVGVTYHATNRFENADVDEGIDVVHDQVLLSFLKYTLIRNYYR